MIDDSPDDAMLLMMVIRDAEQDIFLEQEREVVVRCCELRLLDMNPTWLKAVVESLPPQQLRRGPDLRETMHRTWMAAP